MKKIVRSDSAYPNNNQQSEEIYRQKFDEQELEIDPNQFIEKEGDRD